MSDKSDAGWWEYANKLVSERDALAARLAKAERVARDYLSTYSASHEQWSNGVEQVARDVLEALTTDSAPARTVLSREEMQAENEATTLVKPDSARAAPDCSIVGDGYCRTHKRDMRLCDQARAFEAVEATVDELRSK